MKLATLRNMDTYGRIRIPHEIRSALQIQGETTFELYFDGDAIHLRKCSPYLSIQKQAMDFLDILSRILACDAMICDPDCIIASKGCCLQKDAHINDELSAYVKKGEDHIFSPSEVIYAVAAKKVPVAAIFHIVQENCAKPSMALVLFQRRNREYTPMDYGSAKLVAAMFGKKLPE
ncbi:MAG: AbrB/MazE/SpoVT family DNA-binding domain-containing protein [Lachnospiraceae bacterium]|nr:AbrB/MazE/SpoVT family DNA-binding domain-containing protein [Lachnospiraceae bacterium]